MNLLSSPKSLCIVVLIPCKKMVAQSQFDAAMIMELLDTNELATEQPQLFMRATRRDTESVSRNLKLS